MKDIINILETLPKRRRPAHPGAALRIILEDNDTTQQDFADRLGIARHRLNEILNGKRSVTPDTALRLSKALRTSPEVWLNYSGSTLERRCGFRRKRRLRGCGRRRWLVGCALRVPLRYSSATPRVSGAQTCAIAQPAADNASAPPTIHPIP